MVAHLEECCSHASTEQLEDNVGQAPTEAQPGTGHVNSQSNGRVEASTRNSSSTISTCNHGESDGHTVVLILLGCILLGRCHVHDDEGQHERVQQLAESCMVPREALGWCQVEALAEQQGVAHCGSDATSTLHSRVDAHRFPVKARTTEST